MGHRLRREAGQPARRPPHAALLRHHRPGPRAGEEATRDETSDVESGKILNDRGPGYTAGMGVGFFAAARPARTRRPSAASAAGRPGMSPQFVPNGMGWLLPKGADFLIQTHYHRNGQPARTAPRSASISPRGRSSSRGKRRVNGMKPTERIRPARPTTSAKGGGLSPHRRRAAHGAAAHAPARQADEGDDDPAGRRAGRARRDPGVGLQVAGDVLVQGADPAKAGTKLEIEAVFDNSAGNPNNPSNPPEGRVASASRRPTRCSSASSAWTSAKTPWERIRTSAFPPPGLTDAPPPTKGQLTPELERYLGNWNSATVVKARGGPETKMNGHDVVQKTFDDTFLIVRTTPAAEPARRSTWPLSTRKRRRTGCGPTRRRAR